MMGEKDKRQLRRVLDEVVDNYGDDSVVSVYEGYSGRGMCGEEVDGLEIKDASEVNNLIGEMHIIADRKGVSKSLIPTRQDSLGLGIILY